MVGNCIKETSVHPIGRTLVFVCCLVAMSEPKPVFSSRRGRVTWCARKLGFSADTVSTALGGTFMPPAGSGVSPAREGVRESRGSGGTSPFPLILWPERSGGEPRAWLSRAQQDDRASKKKLPLPRNKPPHQSLRDSFPSRGSLKQRALLRRAQQDDRASKSQTPAAAQLATSSVPSGQLPLKGKP